MLNIKSFVFNQFRENCYVLWDESGAGVVVDPGCLEGLETATLEDYLRKEAVSLGAVWLTHGHFDHIYGAAALQKAYGVPVLLNPADQTILQEFAELARYFRVEVPDISFETSDLGDGDSLRVGNAAFRVIGTPGHSPGGVCFYDEADKVLLTGDTLFAGSIGRTDHAGGDYDRLIIGIMDRLMELPGDVDVLPGHGRRTSIGRERSGNPFLQPFNGPEEDACFE